MINNLLKQAQWRVIDQSLLNPAFEAKQSFAIDDTLCRFVGAGRSPAIARTWVHPKTIVLGIQDARLPHLKEGLDFLKSQQYSVIVRNSGGLAVVLDEGVWNLSFIFSERETRISIDEGFETMVAFIEAMLAPYRLNIEVGEIAHSYCPGRYDMSVNGRKFAGISQRRLRQAVAVQIYLCVNGSGSERARLVQHFYQEALKGEKTKLAYPDIQPDVMASLSEITGQALTMDDIMTAFYKTLQQHNSDLISSALTPEEATSYEKDYLRMVERNDKTFSL
ncbi:octanoyl-[GcvH]:protein N-octanoyltransferase [Pullulanibacillus camelliae]|uniref:Octanoyl-[GcvH]:protein N-octanoyltransferase n=1 Tax=Pullulanibacillus camelliae TaxID=1707096 RepID=A0A8J2YBT5_9BACL|nr:lipoate--protein ligase family protein [Pullulanibacillus camelliae]GGE28853.1 octanoyl-[GcvH]:protein N-octanoyltransferase [Pullulanibacillus camelliae]